jgi:hypothetical protein
MKVTIAPVESPWLWTLAFGYHQNRTRTHGYEPTREAAMPAFAKQSGMTGGGVSRIVYRV